MQHSLSILNSECKGIRVAPPNPAVLSSRVLASVAPGGRAYNGRHLLGGRAPKPGAVLMRSNDYLQIGGHPHIVNAEVQALREGGHGELVSRVFVHGQPDAHRAFEHRLAALAQAEDAVLCMSGYCANVGLLQAIACAETPVYIDMKAHASLWEGVKSAGAAPSPFRHNDPDHLERQIRKRGPGIVVIDALYSTTGTIAPLRDFVEVAERGDCVVVVDETHSFGAQGPDGAGSVVAEGLASRVHFRTLGLSKAIASRGGAVLCSGQNADYFRYEAWPMIFSTTVLAHEVAGYNAALDVIRDEPWRRARLQEVHGRLRSGLAELGYDVSASDAQIISLVAGSEDAVVELRNALEEHGVFGSIFCAPATAKNRALVRLTVNCGLTDNDVLRVMAAAATVRDLPGMDVRLACLQEGLKGSRIAAE